MGVLGQIKGDLSTLPLGEKDLSMGKIKKQLAAELTSGELRIIQLDRTVDELANENDREFAKNLLANYRRYGKLTGKQWHFVKEVTARPKRRISKYHEGVWWLYAATDMRAIKLGMAKDPERRVKALQTGHPLNLELVWKRKVGTRKEAARNEKSLHKFFKEHHLRGEWFDCDVEPLLEGFEIRA